MSESEQSQNPVTERIREALDLLEEVNFFDNYRDSLLDRIRTSPATQDGALQREYLYLQCKALDEILDSLRVKVGH